MRERVGVLGVGVTPRPRGRGALAVARVVLVLDADAAGDAAVRRLCDDVLLTLGTSRRDVVVMRWPDGAKDAADFVEGRRLRGETDAAIASAVRDLCAAATAWNDVDVCDIPINEADAASSSSSAPPDDPPPDENDQEDLRRKIDELQNAREPRRGLRPVRHGWGASGRGAEQRAAPAAGRDDASEPASTPNREAP